MSWNAVPVDISVSSCARFQSVPSFARRITPWDSPAPREARCQVQSLVMPHARDVLRRQLTSFAASQSLQQRAKHPDPNGPATCRNRLTQSRGGSIQGVLDQGVMQRSKNQ